MSNRVRWGVIGSGGIAGRRTIPEGILPAHSAELVSVLDIATGINVQVASRFHVQAANGMDQLLTAEIDAVYVATPARWHYEQVLQCSRRQARSVRKTSGHDRGASGRNARRLPERVECSWAAAS